ncbi:hypothetical protein OSK38_29015, partial [Escherichia coli]|nr:hypothetical protein [Escherichia coli]
YERVPKICQDGAEKLALFFMAPGIFSSQILYPDIHIFKFIENITVVKKPAPIGIPQLMQNGIHSERQRSGNGVGTEYTLRF